MASIEPRTPTPPGTVHQQVVARQLAAAEAALASHLPHCDRPDPEFCSQLAGVDRLRQMATRPVLTGQVA